MNSSLPMPGSIPDDTSSTESVALFIVTSDPRNSPRVAEAVRVAAGLAGWQKVPVTLCLTGAAVLALEETEDDLRDGALFRQHLPALIDAGGRLVVLERNPLLADISHPLAPCQAWDARELAAAAASSKVILHF